MNKKRGRPKTLLGRMSDEPWQEICNTIIYGSRAWRFIELRQLLSGKRRSARTRNAQSGRADIPIFLIRHECVGASSLMRPFGERYFADEATQQRAELLWHGLSQQFENALVIGDDDWLDELAKAIRGEAEPEQSAQFTSKVLVLLRRMAGATASNIYEQLEKHSVWVKKGRGEVEHIKVEGRTFANKQGVLDAIHDIAEKVNHQWKRIDKT